MNKVVKHKLIKENVYLNSIINASRKTFTRSLCSMENRNHISREKESQNF